MPANDDTQAEGTTLTQATYERLVAELDDLKTRGRSEIATTIEAARALGDLSENGDYHAAKDTQGKMEARIRHLEALLKKATIASEEGSGDGTVATGSTVILRYDGDDDDDVQRYFVGSIEERPGDTPVVSPSAPLGKALLGKRSGDSVDYEAPGGSLRVTIVEVGR
jgi:transcription elongation factor GreA